MKEINKKTRRSVGFEELLFILDKPKRFTEILEEAKDFGITHSTINRQINKMLGLGLIERKIIDLEKRGKILYELTEKGKKLSLEIEVQNEFVKLLSSLTLDEIKKLKEDIREKFFWKAIKYRKT